MRRFLTNIFLELDKFGVLRLLEHARRDRRICCEFVLHILDLVRKLLRGFVVAIVLLNEVSMRAQFRQLLLEFLVLFRFSRVGVLFLIPPWSFNIGIVISVLDNGGEEWFQVGYDGIRDEIGAEGAAALTPQGAVSELVRVPVLAAGIIEASAEPEVFLVRQNFCGPCNSAWSSCPTHHCRHSGPLAQTVRGGCLADGQLCSRAATTPVLCRDAASELWHGHGTCASCSAKRVPP